MLTEEQKRQRLGKVTSSVAAAALGLNPRMTPIEAWLAIRGEGAEPVNQKAIDRGNRLEEIVLRSVAEDLGLVMGPKPEFRSIAPWAGDSADAVYLNDAGELVAIGEGKSAALGVAKGYGKEGTDDIPDSTLIQAHWHLIHWTEVNVCWVPVLVGGYAFEFRRYRVERDRELEGEMLQDLEQWHRDYIIGERPPPVEANDEAWILKRFPKASAGMMASTAEIADLAREYHEAHLALKDAEVSKKKAGARLRMLLGNHEGVKADWGTLYHRNTKDITKVDWEAIVKELNAPQDLINKHTTVFAGARQLRVYPKKDKSNGR